MPYPPTIDDYYRSVVEEAKKEINATADDQVLGVPENDSSGENPNPMPSSVDRTGPATRREPRFGTSRFPRLIY
jgi:hypothetical protein